VQGATAEQQLEAAEAQEAASAAQVDAQDQLTAALAARGRQDNLSFFAFTATPKARTLELFGTRDADGNHGSFHLYSMKQAIEEGFILDVLKGYATYGSYWKIAAAAAEDPDVDKAKAAAQLARFVSLHPTNLAQKAEVIIEHFRTHTRRKIGGRAKAMVVTRSRLHAVRYKRAIDDYIREKGHRDIHTLVAFSGTVVDEGVDYTEPQMNSGLAESALPAKFAGDDHPAADRRREVPDRLRPAVAAHDVRRQEARRRQGRADAQPPQPHPPRQDRHLHPGLRQRHTSRSRTRSSRSSRRRSPSRPTRTCSTTPPPGWTSSA